jgi:RNA polymerase sigma-70 factor (ECF subfamily)
MDGGPREITQNDAELVVRCQQHDPGAFRVLVERYRRRAWKIAYNMVGNMEVARDISQEAFVRVFRGISGCDPGRGFRQWFDRIIVNLSIDYLRRRRGVQAVPLDVVAEPQIEAEEPGTRWVRDDTRRLVHEVLQELPLKHRSVLVMRDIDGMDYEEIAKIMGKSPGTIRWRLNQARQAFKRAWQRRSSR